MKLLQPTFELNWANPNDDYERIVQMRTENAVNLMHNQGAIPKLFEYYADGRWPQMISDWFWTFDPRPVDPKWAYRPFILYQRQVDYVQWVYDMYMRQETGLVEKPRGVGMSWLNSAIAACVWMLHRDRVMTLGSQKQEKVDNGDGDPDSLFWKVRQLVGRLPVVMQPEGWKESAKKMLLYNPTNGSTIRGEIGDQIGRGGRASIVFLDEFAEIEHQEMVESSVSATSPVVIFGSTPPQGGGVGTKFYELRMQLPEDQVFTFRLEDDPRIMVEPGVELEKQEPYKKLVRGKTPSVVRSQYLLDYSGGASNTFIDEAHHIDAAFKRALDAGSVTPVGGWRIGIDAAGMGNDKIKIWARRGRVNLRARTYEKLDGLELAQVVLDLARNLRETAEIELVCIEKDGPGQSCADQLKYTWLGPVLRAIHTGARLKDGKHYNLRSWLHAQARDYLYEEEPAIPSSQTFKTQATAIRKEYKGGMLLIESKDSYRRRFSMSTRKGAMYSSRSPDEWDSFMLTFMIPTGEKAGQEDAGLGDLGASRWEPLDKMMGY